MTDERDIADERARPRSGAPYVYALIALLCLTGLSLGLHFAELGAVGPAAALAIAAVKVCIVAIVFMELRESMAATRTLGLYGDVGFR